MSVLRQPTRRQFLGYGAASATALGIDAVMPDCFLRAADLGSNSAERILVVIQLSGGNDGLNTVVPFSDPAYSAARAKLAIPTSDVLKLNDELGFHPSLRGIRELHEQGQVAVIQGVGYENPNRSHFESMDIWHTCQRKTETRQDGWLGRYLQRHLHSVGGDVAAIHLGDQKQPLALLSQQVHVPTVKNLGEFQLRGANSDALRELLQQGTSSNRRELSSADPSNELLGFLKVSTQSAVAASARVSEAAKEYRSQVKYPDSQIASQLRVVAQLIDAGLKTRVYYLQLDGFDTHAHQPDTHAILLRQWSDAVTAFVNDMSSQGNAERICVMTFSEFGRRVAENASDGTDHGAAGPMFLCGGRLNSGIHGSNPDLQDLQQGDLKHQIDFRRVYASVLKSWLTADTETILHGQYEPLDLFDSAV